MKVYQTILVAAGLISKESVQGHQWTALDVIPPAITDKDRGTQIRASQLLIVREQIENVYGKRV